MSDGRQRRRKVPCIRHILEPRRNSGAACAQREGKGIARIASHPRMSCPPFPQRAASPTARSASQAHSLAAFAVSRSAAGGLEIDDATAGGGPRSLARSHPPRRWRCTRQRQLLGAPPRRSAHGSCRLSPRRGPARSTPCALSAPARLPRRSRCSSQGLQRT
jgi:hypothetical protein